MRNIFATSVKIAVVAAGIMLCHDSLAAVEEIRIVAVVNDEVITSRDLDEALKHHENQLAQILEPKAKAGTKNKDKVLDDMIRDRLLEQEMKRLGVQVSGREIDEEIQRILKRSQLDMDRLEKELAEQHLSMSEYRDSIADHLQLLKFIGRKIRPKVSIDDDDIQTYYQNHPLEFSTPDRVRLWQVAVEQNMQKATLEALRAALAGAAGDSGIRKIEQDFPNTSVTDLGAVELGDLSEQIRGAVSKLPEGGVSNLIRDPKVKRGYFFKVFNRDSQNLIPLEQVKDQIRAVLFEREIQQEIQVYLQNLKRTAHIEMRLQN